ncbi:MAG: carbohydrate kinase family protein [Ginsengibacter sp.]
MPKITKMSNKYHYSVVCFGEVLWDILPSGEVPGGAPMNVAYHLHKQHKNPAIISSIGNDEKGKKLIDIFSSECICTNFIQVDSEHETGKVFAIPNEHHDVTYDIVNPVAWDFINWEDALYRLVSNADYFVFGSLAARSSQSKKTLFQLIESAKIKVLDINLRPPHYDRKIVEELLAKADLLKLNLAELELITSWFSQFTTTKDRVKSLMDKFNLKNIVITKGGDGAILFYNGYEYKHKGYKVKVVDTVGSGDAFLAGFIANLSENATPEQCLDSANRLGAFIATKKGGCPDYDISEVDTYFKNLAPYSNNGS